MRSRLSPPACVSPRSASSAGAATSSATISSIAGSAHGADRAPRRDQVVLRRLFLRDSAPHGHRQARRDRARARSWQGLRHASCRGLKAGVMPDTAWKRASAQATLVSRRDHQLRHRSGLCDGDAASTRPCCGQDRVRQERSCRVSCARAGRRSDQPQTTLHRSGASAARPRRHGRGGKREGRHRHPRRAQASRHADGRQDGHRAGLRTWRRPSLQRTGKPNPIRCSSPLRRSTRRVTRSLAWSSTAAGVRRPLRRSSAT